MIVNSDLNILGGLPDWNLINVFLKNSFGELRKEGGIQKYTSIKTDKSVKRFEKAIKNTLILFGNTEIESLVLSVLNQENLSKDTLLLLFWNASFNNELLHYLNSQVYFPAFYSGRISIKQEEVLACLKDLRERENELKKWSESTMKTTASKYLTLLKKFHLLEGAITKRVLHPYLDEKMFIFFVYWLSSVEQKSNLIESEWMKYSFSEKNVFLERVMQKKLGKYFHFNYTPNKLKIETSIPYSNLYDAII